MSAVWKFVVPAPTPTGRSFIDLPVGASLLSAGIQGDEMVVWALVPDPDVETECHRLIVANTGDAIPFPTEARFLGTLISAAGVVWHVWDA